MEYKILSSRSPEELSRKVNELIQEGWEVIGGHSVVEVHRQNRFSGSQHMDTRIEVEYSQTLCRKTEENVIKVDISYYHPDDDETIKVYDVEGMREEFEYELQHLLTNKPQ